LSPVGFLFSLPILFFPRRIYWLFFTPPPDGEEIRIDAGGVRSRKRFGYFPSLVVSESFFP